MSLHDPRTRRLARGLARTATMLSAVALGITIWGMSLSGVPHASAVPIAGPAEVVTPAGGPNPGQPLAGGGSATAFTLELPAASACTGDSANGGYRIQSYMVPAAVDPATLTFDAAGPVPGGLGASFKQPLFDTTGTGYVDAQTANANPAGGPGPVLNIPAFDLAVYVPGDIPAGNYNLGIACTLGPASATQLDRYWNVQLNVSTDAADVPAGVTWVVVAPPTTTTTTLPSTSTSSTTSSSTSSTTTTSVPASSTTSTSSTTSSTSSSTTTVPSSTTTSTTSPSTTSTSSTSTTTTVPSSTTSSTVTSTTRPSTTTSTAATDSSSTSTTGATDGSTDGIFDGGTTDGSTDPTVLGGGGTPTGSSGVGSTGGLPRTGSSTVALLVWAVLLLVFGRMAVLLGRPPRVLPSLRP